MKCQKCQTNEATTYFRQYVNGKTEEYHLCSECAKELGIGEMFEGFAGSFANFNPFAQMFSSFMGFPSVFSKTLPPTTKCKTCGMTFDQIADSGRVGCADCYETFRSQLAPSIERIHGRTAHTGKHPGKVSAAETAAQPKNELAELKEKLQKAIDAQEYEQAAVYRDRIRELEGSND